MSASTRAARAAAATATARTRRPKVVAGYLRLTVDRHGNKIGYEAQRRAIQQWADAYEYRVVWFKDEDLTAAKREVVRPQYEDMLKRLAAGQFAGIVVWRLDRLVRLTREFERCFGVVEDASAFIQDVEQKINTDSDVGRLLMRLLVMLAEMEIAAMRARAREHQKYKAAEGKVSMGGHRPFGFVGVVKDPNTKVIINKDVAWKGHVPEEAKLLREAAQRIAYGGATYADIVDEWAERVPPVLGTQGKHFEASALHKILTRARIAGFREVDVIGDDGESVEVQTVDAEWDGIIDEETWKVLRERGVPYARRATGGKYLFVGGFATCANCGFPLIIGSLKQYSGEYQPVYKCNPSKVARMAGSCGGPSVLVEYLEKTVLDRLFGRLEKTPSLFELVNAGMDKKVAAERKKALKERVFCASALSAIGERVALPDDDPMYLTEEEAAGRAKTYRSRLQKAKDVLENFRISSSTPAPSEEDQKDIRAWFDSLALGEKQSWLRVYLRKVSITPVKRRSRFFDPDRVVTLFADAKAIRQAAQ